MGVRLVALAAACLVVAGCATGPTLQQSQASVPQLSPDCGRVYFYRTNCGFGAAIRPYVKLDEIAVSDAAVSRFVESQYQHVQAFGKNQGGNL